MGESFEAGVDPRIFGYRWTTAEDALISFGRDATKYTLPQTPVSARSSSRQSASPSSIESLPLEIIQSILNSLDPGNLATLRRVSYTMSDLVESLPAFHDLMRYAPYALKALGRTRLVHQHSIAKLHKVLQSPRCEYCSNYGPCLYLLHCTRCCFVCLSRDDRLASVPLDQAQKYLQSLGIHECENVTMLLTLPEKYSAARNSGKTRLWLVNEGDIESIVRNTCKKSPAVQNKMRILHLRPRDRGNQQLRLHCRAAVTFPSVCITDDSMTVQHGIWCRGCEDTWLLLSMLHTSWAEHRQLREAPRVAYSNQDFAAHCAVCPGIKRLKDLGYPNFRSTPEHRRNHIPIC